MSSPLRRLLVWLVTDCLALVGCTKLEDPNQVFGSAARAGARGTSTGGDGSGGSLASGSAGNDEAPETANAGSSNALGSAGAGTASADGGSAGEAGAPNVSCQDPTGFHGLGCSTCAGSDIFSLENACSPVACTRFDNGLRLTKHGTNGALPALPAPNSGAGGSASNGGTNANDIVIVCL